MRTSLRLGLAGVIVMGLGRLAATGRLPRNLVAGIRIPSTLRSDEAWDAGHRAAASALTVAGAAPLALGVYAASTRKDPESRSVLTRAGTAWLLGWLGLATFRANRAARATTAG